eukprot:TRINITY_DN2832_c2_g4_i1.p1 TRINITY_DN2832_c2_g4~~TRINITY_DN2832_c2_g4_i1.p1  ORF type:complete len:201 (+),score=58.51 TRINITY_DN2832_c2_g4_i1:166-768(+)
MKTKTVFKVVLVGAASVGKTSLMNRFLRNQFVEKIPQTIGVNHGSTYLVISDRNVRMQIWDCAGSERFRSIARVYFRDTHGVIIVYNVNDPTSFEAVSSVLEEVRNICNSNCVVFLVGNQKDNNDEPIVSTQRAKLFAEEKGLVFMETSAATGKNVHDLFESVALDIYKKTINGDLKPFSMPSGVESEIIEEEASKGCSC